MFLSPYCSFMNLTKIQYFKVQGNMKYVKWTSSLRWILQQVFESILFWNLLWIQLKMQYFKVQGNILNIKTFIKKRNEICEVKIPAPYFYQTLPACACQTTFCDNKDHWYQNAQRDNFLENVDLVSWLTYIVAM